MKLGLPQKEDESKLEDFPEVSLEELFQTELELETEEQDQGEKDDAIINLLDLAAVVREHGMPQAVCQLVDESGQLSGYLELDLNQYESDEERGTAVADKIREKVLTDDPDLVEKRQLDVSSEAFLGGLGIGAIAAIGAGLIALGAFLDKWLGSAKNLHKTMEKIKDKKLSNKDKVDVEHFNSIKKKMWPKKQLQSYLKALSNLGDYLAGLAESGDDLDREKVAGLINDAGYKVDPNDPSKPKLRDDFEREKATLEEHDFTFDNFVSAYSSVMNMLETAMDKGKTLQKHAEKMKEKKEQAGSDSESEAEEKMSEKELKEYKQKLKTNRDIFKKAMKFYFDSVRQEAQAFIELGEQVKLK